MESSLQGLGLGIDFDPPPSPQAANSPVNPAISRLQGQAALGKKPLLPSSVLLSRRTASANDADTRIRRHQKTDTNDEYSSSEQQEEQEYGVYHPPPVTRRKVRIVSAANTYHEQHYLSSGENSPALGEDEDGYSDAASAASPYDGMREYNDQGDILDDYASSPHQANDNPYEEQDSIVYPSLSDPSPAPTMQTTLSARSLGAVSSGSSTRYNDALTMAHPQHTTETSHAANKVEEFEAKLASLNIQDDYSGYGAYHRPPPSHQRSYTVDETLPTSQAVATIRGNLPVSNSTNNLTKGPILRRAGAMSRPKSMMELNQLYSAGAHVDVQELRQSFSRDQREMHYGVPQHASASMEHQLSVQTTASSSAGIYSETSPASVFTEEGYASSAPSSVFGAGSAEPKPSALFMGKQASSATPQQAPAMQTGPSSSSSSHHTFPRQHYIQHQQQQASQPQIRRAQSAISMRSMASMRGLEEAETGGAAVVLDSLGKGFVQGVPLDPRHAGQLGSPSIVFGSKELVQGSILMAQTASEQSSQQGRSRAASTATNKTASSSGHSRAASSSLASLPSTQGLPSLTGGAQALQRQSTLLSAGGNPLKRAKELDRLLDPKPAQVRSQYSPTAEPYHSTDMPSRATFASDPAEEGGKSNTTGGSSFHPHGIAVSSHLQLKRKPSTVVLEQSAKGKARVELDLTLAGTMVVEGGKLKGRMDVRVRKEKAGEGEVWLGAVKARIVGFEELAGEDARHVFYHHSVNIDQIPSSGPSDSVPLPCYASKADNEGFCKGKTGAHAFPFEMHLPVGKGAKGSWRGKAGVVKYIVIGSIKLKSHVGLDRSIAHFYRHIDVFPYLNPSIILAPAVKPLHAETSKALFMGGSGKVYLKASLHRSTWIAGQRCYANLHVRNEASKKIKTLTLSLIRTTTIFRPKPHLTAGNGFDDKDPVYADIDQDACSTQTTKKKIAETSLDMGKKNAKGSVTAKGMWMGVDANQETEFCHFLELPSDALTIERGRYLEISYALKVSVSGSLSSDVSVEIPCRIINFVSIDPPPGHPGPAQSSEPASHKPMTRAWSTAYLRQINQNEQTTTPQSAQVSGRSAMGRMTSMDSLNMQDLNKMYNTQHGMFRQHSYASQVSERQASSQGLPMARSFTMPSGLHIIQENRGEYADSPSTQPDLPGADPIMRRQLRHQMSLDCIGSAIASATARRAGHQRTNSGLSLGYTAEEEEQEAPPLPYLQDYNNDTRSRGVQLDDLDDIPDEYEQLSIPQPGYLHPAHHLHYNQRDGTPYSYSEHIQLHDTDYAEYEDESEDEVDLVLQAKQYESDEEYECDPSARAPPFPPDSHSRSINGPRHPTLPASLKPAISRVPHSIMARAQLGSNNPTSAEDSIRPSSGAESSLGASARMSFGVASPASPVKKSYTPITSPPRRNTRTLAPQTSTNAGGRSPRMTPASPSSIAGAKTSASSLRKARPSPNSETASSPALNRDARRQQVERVPGPLSTPSVIRSQPMKGGMRKMASTSVLRSSGM